MPRDSAAADRPASYLVGTAAAFPLFFRDRTKPINQLPFSPSANFPKSGSSCESRAKLPRRQGDRDRKHGPCLRGLREVGWFSGKGLVRRLATGGVSAAQLCTACRVGGEDCRRLGISPGRYIRRSCRSFSPSQRLRVGL